MNHTQSDWGRDELDKFVESHQHDFQPTTLCIGGKRRFVCTGCPATEMRWLPKEDLLKIYGAAWVKNLATQPPRSQSHD